MAQQGQGHWVAPGTAEALGGVYVTLCYLHPLGQGTGGAIDAPDVVLGWKAKVSSPTSSAHPLHHGRVSCPCPRVAGAAGGRPLARDGSSLGSFPRFPRVSAASPTVPNSPSGVERGSCSCRQPGRARSRCPGHLGSLPGVCSHRRSSRAHRLLLPPCSGVSSEIPSSGRCGKRGENVFLALASVGKSSWL